MLVYQRVWGLKHIETIQVYHAFRVDQWIDRSIWDGDLSNSTGTMELLRGVPISIQVASNFKFEFFVLWV